MTDTSNNTTTMVNYKTYMEYGPFDKIDYYLNSTKSHVISMIKIKYVYNTTRAAFFLQINAVEREENVSFLFTNNCEVICCTNDEIEIWKNGVRLSEDHIEFVKEIVRMRCTNLLTSDTRLSLNTSVINMGTIEDDVNHKTVLRNIIWDIYIAIQKIAHKHPVNATRISTLNIIDELMSKKNDLEKKNNEAMQKYEQLILENKKLKEVITKRDENDKKYQKEIGELKKENIASSKLLKDAEIDLKRTLQELINIKNQLIVVKQYNTQLENERNMKKSITYTEQSVQCNLSEDENKKNTSLIEELSDENDELKNQISQKNETIEKMDSSHQQIYCMMTELLKTKDETLKISDEEKNKLLHNNQILQSTINDLQNTIKEIKQKKC